MKQFYAQGTLRDKYIGLKPIYHVCVNCKKAFQHGPLHSLKGKHTMSKYPYCMKCLAKNAESPDFKTWLLKIFGLPSLKTK